MTISYKTLGAAFAVAAASFAAPLLFTPSSAYAAPPRLLRWGKLLRKRRVLHHARLL